MMSTEQVQGQGNVGVFSQEEVQLDGVVIKNVEAVIPPHYSQLFARACSNKGQSCVMCKGEFENGDLQIGSSEVVVFHYFCLLSDNSFEGKVDEIRGFDGISREHRDLLRSNVTTNTEDSDMESDEWASGLDDEDDIPPPPKKTPPTSMQRKGVLDSAPKTKEKQEYEAVLKLFCGEDCRTNPERGWPFRTDDLSQVKQVVKRGVLIDKEFPQAENCWCLRSDRGDLYAATMVMCDISQNRNSYFKMQLLQEEEFQIFHLFRSWGRIGTKRGACFTEAFTTVEEAIREFEKDFEAVTGNRWRERHFFHPKSGYLSLIEMDYTEFETMIVDESGSLIPAGSCSSLADPIRRILLNIFDSKNIKKALDEYAMDLERMPMGKLSAKQLSKASHLLNRITEMVQQNGPGTEDFMSDVFERNISRMSSEFYSILPQSFGHVTPAALVKPAQQDKMRGMLDALLDIQFVCNILNETRKEAGAKGLDPLDLQYNRLMTNMEVVPTASDEFNRIVAYINNGLGSTHSYSKMTLLDLIRMERYGEAAKFKGGLGNRKLLWHGSPIQNFPGILTQGLRIAPSDAIQTGHAFGRGVYFADMISKSANYCRAENNVGYLLLCDVALGKMKEQGWGGSAGLSSNETNYNSVKGVGSTGPDPKGDWKHPQHEYTIPLGKPISDKNHRGASGGFLYYNEYIVYDIDQIQVRYLCRVQFG